MNWHTVTFFGDSTFTVPGACILALWLATNGMWRPMFYWLFSFGTAMMIVVITKLLFMGWDISLPLLNFTGISGHSASSSALYLAIAFLLTQGMATRRRVIVVGLVAVAVASIGLSRLMIKVHSESEVILGLAVGALAAWCFARSLPQTRLALRHLFLPAALAASLLLTGFGKPAPTQGFLQEVAKMLSGHSEVYTRHEPL